MITEYTSYAAVRAVLGVSSDEIEDSVIDLPLYETMLSEDLLDLSSTIETDYNTAKELTSPSAVEIRFVKIMQTYASYQVAYTLLGSIKLFAPKDIKDGKAAVGRVADPFLGLEDSITKALAYIRIRLLSSYQAYNPSHLAPSPITRSLIKNVGLSVDPITG